MAYILTIVFIYDTINSTKKIGGQDEKVITLCLIVSLLFTMFSPTTFANKATVESLLRGKTISELITNNEATGVGVYSLNGKHYNAYRVESSIAGLHPYAIFTDSNNRIVTNEDITNKLYDIYYFHNVLDVDTSTKAMRSYVETTSLFREFEMIKSGASLIGTLGAGVISPEVLKSSLISFGKEEFKKMFSPDNVVRMYFSMLYV